jgi:hypothetical protein
MRGPMSVIEAGGWMGDRGKKRWAVPSRMAWQENDPDLRTHERVPMH